MQGRRVEFRNEWDEGSRPRPGNYWKDPDGAWGGVTPNGLHCRLSGHRVTEHADGTITVAGSIIIKSEVQGSWHGFLEKGVWREV